MALSLPTFSPERTARVLIVSDDPLVGSVLSKGLKRSGQEAETCAPDEAARKHREQGYHAVLLDMGDRGAALALLGELRRSSESPVTLVLVSAGDPEGIVALMRGGAYDVLVRPLDLSEVIERLERVLAGSTMRRRLATSGGGAEAGLVAESPAMKDVMRLVDRVARTPRSSVLIVGESGVGKEKVAEQIHQQSQRRDRPFVRVNMAALPESMVEAELFGHVRGAFTGATRPRLGLLASAEGGTVLLDEVTELKLDLQPKLLRVLEERRYFPVGSDQEKQLDVRVLAATNRDPHEAIQRGQLRADLYYRLAAVTIKLPPLRERIEDVLPLAQRFLDGFAVEFGRGALRLSEEASESLLQHEWRGNVRELRNVLERAAMLAEGDELQIDDIGIFPAERQSSPRLRAVRLQEAVDETERARLSQALREASGDAVQAARLLGISRSTLYSKRKRLGL